VHDLALAVAVDPAGGETEGLDQEVVRRLNVDVHQDGDDALRLRSHAGPYATHRGGLEKN